MIDKFLQHIQGKHNSKANLRLLKYSLQKVENCTGKYLDNLTYEDISDFFKELDMKEYMEDSSIETIQRKLIQYYNWMFDSTDDPKFHKLAKQIKNGKIARPKTKISPVDLVSPEEVKSLINTSSLERDRVIIAILWEGGLRVGELLALTNSMVQIDTIKKEVILHIPNIEGCKTGARSVPCVEIYPYIVAWLKCNSNNPNDKFIPIGDKQLRNIVAKLYKKANINKKCNPHMLRHSQITYMASLGYSESNLSNRFWGINHSAMVSVYIHLSEQQKADAYRNAKGLGTNNGKTIINPIACRCIECGDLIETGSLCKKCEDNKNLKEKVKTLENLVNTQNEQIEKILTGIATFEIGKEIAKDLKKK